MNLYLDVDGVLLGKRDPASSTTTLACHAREFLEFATANFDLYWLTTHCDGTVEPVMRHLRPYCPDDVTTLMAQM